MTVSGIVCNMIVAALVGHLPLVYFIGMLHHKLAYPRLINVSACGTALSGVAALLFALINPNATYWAFGFPGAILAVVGADFVFAGGTLFIAKVSLPHEQSLAGAVFQTMTQVVSSILEGQRN